MNTSIKNKVVAVVMIVFFLGLSAFNWLKPADAFSDSERRALAQFPVVSAKEILSGDFMTKFESYTLDQFPLRDGFRNVKALVASNVFGKRDNNGIYVEDGYVSKIEYPMKEDAVKRAGERFLYVYEKYLVGTDANVYVSIVPDKNYFLAEENGYLSMDYEELFSYMEEKVSYAEFIDLVPYLDISDYYRTDTHWKQECILDVAEVLKLAMDEGKEISATKEEIEERANIAYNTYKIEKLEKPFRGVYYGQAALPLKADTLYYLDSEILQQCKVTSYDTGKPVETVIYNMKKAEGKDPYEMFLSGTSALQVIENPRAKTEKELVVFRDSFGSSLVPLLVEEYSKITVIDIRYVQSNILGQFVDFHGQDTLFLYSTVVLNNSMSLR